MKKEQPHIIEKLLVDVDTSTTQSAYELKDNISSFINGTLVTTLNSYFENKGQELGTISLQLEHFSLDLNISEGDFDSKYIKEAIESEIARQLDPVFNDPESTIVHRKQSESDRSLADSSGSDFTADDPSKALYLTEKQKQWKAIIHFLETGSTPWWIKTNEEMALLMQHDQIKTIIQEEINVVRPVLRKKLSNSSFKSRAIRQLENDSFVALLTAIKSASTLLTSNPEFLRSFNQVTENLSSQNREFFRSLLVELVTNDASPIPSVLALIQSTINQQLKDSSRTSKTSTKKKINDLIALSAALISEEPQQTIPFDAFKKQVQQSLRLTASETTKSEFSKDDQKSITQAAQPIEKQTTENLSERETTDSSASSNNVELENIETQEANRIAEEKNARNSQKSKSDGTASEEVHKAAKSSDELASKKHSSIEDITSDSTIEKSRHSKKTGATTEDELQQAIRKQESANNRASGIQSSDEELPQNQIDEEKFNHAETSLSEKQTDEKSLHESELHIEDLRVEQTQKSSSIPSIEKDQQETTISDKKQLTNERESNPTDTGSIDNTIDSTEQQKTAERQTEHIDQSVQKKLSEAEQLEILTKKLEPEQLIINLDQLPKTPLPAVNGFIAENAGLVLLHPFLKHLFLKLELLDGDNQLKDPVRAVHILHFAATGIECDYEYSMTFEKYLCNVPLDLAIPKDIQLSDDIKQEVDALLNSALDHWKALKSKSIALLRNEFLQRPGKLMIDEQSPRIVFERKAFDLMLDKLPWNISIVKLVWLDSMIFIEW